MNQSRAKGLALNRTYKRWLDDVREGRIPVIPKTTRKRWNRKMRAGKFKRYYCPIKTVK